MSKNSNLGRKKIFWKLMEFEDFLNFEWEKKQVKKGRKWIKK